MKCVGVMNLIVAMNKGLLQVGNNASHYKSVEDMEVLMLRGHG